MVPLWSVSFSVAFEVGSSVVFEVGSSVVFEVGSSVVFEDNIPLTSPIIDSIKPDNKTAFIVIMIITRSIFKLDVLFFFILVIVRLNR
jgi:hypothetical protein